MNRTSPAAFALRLAWARLTGKPRPFLVQLNVTNRCNYRCAYCYNQYFTRPEPDQPLARLTAIVDALAAAGLTRLNLVGGEPLARADLDKLIDHAKSKGILTAMTTNGALVPARMDTVRRLDAVCLSLDGRRESNDLGRGVGSHDRVLAAMEACRAAGVPLQLSAVLTRHTVDDVDYLAELAASFGCLVGFTPLISQDRESRHTGHDLYPSPEELRAALDAIVALKERGAPILFSSRVYRYTRDWPAPNQDVLPQGLPGFTPIPCKAGQCFCLVDVNGDVYPCPQLVGRFSAKNILTHGLQASLARAANHGCQACAIPCSNQFSLFFGWSPGAMLDAWRAARKHP